MILIVPATRALAIPMADHLFFLSYARNDKNGYLEKFHEELSEAVARWSARPAAQVGFFDRSGIELGADWPAALVEGLQSSRVLVSLYSPSYFTREYCGKEWSLFRMRQEELARARPGTPPPEAILPVLWMPRESLPAELPPAAGELQFDHGALGGEYVREGLLQLRTLSIYRDQYEIVVNQLAKRIVELSRQKLPRHPRVKSPADLANAFAAPKPSPSFGAPPAPPAAPAGLGKEGPRHVQCVYVAARRGELAAQRVRAGLDAYGEESGMEWSPYHPKLSDEIGLLVNHVTVGEGFLYTHGEVDEALLARLEDAKRRNKIVVMVVDAWTLCLDAYRQRMREVDERNFFNTAILVPWNPDDPETTERGDELQAQLKGTLVGRYVTRDQFADAIESAETLKDRLKEVLSTARMRVITAAEVLKKAEGDRIVPRPVVSGPGGAGR
jgi:FxsC-like protein